MTTFYVHTRAGRKVRLVRDLGVVSMSPFTVEDAIGTAVRVGKRRGYPECCVAQYVVDLLNGHLPAMRRGTLHTETGGRYVPCYACCEQIGRVVA